MTTSPRRRRPLAAALATALTTALAASALSLSMSTPAAVAAPGPTDVVRSFNAITSTTGAIPDGPNTGGTCSTTTPSVKEVSIPVSGIVDPLSDVRIQLALEHDKIGDVGLQLVAPDGTTVAFLDRIGADRVGCGDDSGFNGTFTFYDGAPGNMAALAASVDSTRDLTTGSYSPSTAAGSPVPLSAPFATAQANGTWKLRILDYEAGTVGRVYAATLTLAQLDRSATPACVSAKTNFKVAKQALSKASKKFQAAKTTLAKLERRHAPKAARAKAARKKVKTKSVADTARANVRSAGYVKSVTCG